MTISSNSPLLSVLIPGAWSWSHVVKRGTQVKLTDCEGGGNASMLAWASWNTSERFNMADTLKAQHISRYAKHCVLYSDMGRVLLSVVDSTLDWHDALGGMGYPGLLDKKYGAKSYQDHRNTYHRDLNTILSAEAFRLGLTRADLHSNINWFSKLAIDPSGNLAFCQNHSGPGSSVTLRAEMDCLIIIAAAPHPLDSSKEWNPKPIRVELFKGELAGPEDSCRTWCEENERGFKNTEVFYV